LETLISADIFIIRYRRQPYTNCAGFAADTQVVALPRMPASFQNRRLKAFSLGHEHTLALDRAGQQLENLL